MRILIVEDKLERIKVFVEKMFPNELHICTNAQAAIATIGMIRTFDEIWLDNDLDDEPYVRDEKDEKFNSGYTVAKYLSYLNTGSRVIIHSQNIYGSEDIKKLLLHSQQIPFHPNMFN